MWKDLKLFFIKCLIGSLFVVALLFTYGNINSFKLLKDNYGVKPWTEPPTQELAKKIRDRSVPVADEYGNQGSGCELVPGLTITARHVVGHAILDSMLTGTLAITANGKKVIGHKHSKTLSDYALLMTEPEHKIDLSKIEFTSITPFIGQDVYISGSPGVINNPYNPAKIIQIEKNSQHGHTDLKLSGQYADFGLSGGCIYDLEGKFMGILKTKPEGLTHIGFVTLITKLE